MLELEIYEVLLSNANANGYTIESQRDCVLLVWVLTVWCVQFGFGSWKAIFHGAQRVWGWYHIFDTLLVLFCTNWDNGMARKTYYVTPVRSSMGEVTGIIIVNFIIITKWQSVITGSEKKKRSSALQHPQNNQNHFLCFLMISYSFNEPLLTYAHTQIHTHTRLWRYISYKSQAMTLFLTQHCKPHKL